MSRGFTRIVSFLAVLIVEPFRPGHCAGATPAAAIHVLSGFKVDLLHTADGSEGSWISIADDDLGRLIVSPQSGGNLLRMTLSNGSLAKIERINQPVTSAMGLLYVDDSLLLDGSGPKGWGIYRLKAQGDNFAAPEFLRPLSDSAEHGSHGMALGPDHKVYLVCGDFVKVPSDISSNSPYQNYADDQLLPRVEDARGWAIGCTPPVGHVLRMDVNGGHPELFAGGTRNIYSIAFNADGEFFGFDNDMEWDWGMAWYRPTRVNHWVAGGDYGFREGSGKFPEYYEDTLPAAINIGLGAPTGVKFGTGSKFPKPYRNALFIEDWTYGRLLAVHLQPHGATYDATVETMVRGTPLNLTALEFGPDGNLYFITGGRNTQSGLYRLSYIGPDVKEERPTKTQLAVDEAAKTARRLRHDLEWFDGKCDPRIVDVIWPCLKSEDRWIRYAARVALEFQKADWWRNRALNERDTFGGLTALLALARSGGPQAQPELLTALKKFRFDKLNEEQKLLELRVIELSFIRQGPPSTKLASAFIDMLGPKYPSASTDINRELCQLLLYLNAPMAVAKTMALLDKAPTLEEQSYYVMRLRNIREGWTDGDRKKYLDWFNKPHNQATHPAQILQYFADVGCGYSDGLSVPQFLNNFRQEAINTFSPGGHERMIASPPQQFQPLRPRPMGGRLVAGQFGPPPIRQPQPPLKRTIPQPVPSGPASRLSPAARAISQSIIQSSQIGSRTRSTTHPTAASAQIPRLVSPVPQIARMVLMSSERRSESVTGGARADASLIPPRSLPGAPEGKSMPFAISLHSLSSLRPGASGRRSARQYGDAFPLNSQERGFFKNWKMADLLPDLDKVSAVRSLDQGKAAFSQANCILCHRFGGNGGLVGPDLSAVSTRLAPRDILESILAPSGVLPEQYQNTVFVLKSGDILVGRVVQEDNQRIELMVDPVQSTKIEVREADIQQKRLSKISPMPEGLLNSMTSEQIWDLAAYLESGGETNLASFKK